MQVENPVHQPDCANMQAGEAGHRPGDTAPDDANEHRVVELTERSAQWREQRQEIRPVMVLARLSRVPNGWQGVPVRLMNADRFDHSRSGNC
jgi:hypothetical protein